MTFVKGQTTWSNIVPKLIGLACGEQADDAGVTVAGSDRWVRMGGVADTALRSPKSRDIPTGQLAMRQGYFNYTSSALRNHGGQAPGYDGWIQTAFVRVVNVFTALPPDYRRGYNSGKPGNYNETTAKRWFVNIWAAAYNNAKDANGLYTQEGDYSSTKWTMRLIDADNGYFMFQQDNVAADADGYVTFVGGLKVQVGNPDGWTGATPTPGMMRRGVIERQESYFRLFTGPDAGGYMGGIDWWPNLWRASEAPTFSTPVTGGIEETDYSILTPSHEWAQFPTWLDSSQQGSNARIPLQMRYSWGLGVGYKTNTALTGARYVVSWPMSKFMFRLFAESGSRNGSIMIQTGLIAQDKTSGQRRYQIHGHAGSSNDSNGTTYDAQNFLKPFNVPGSVDPNAPIQYWMRVTAKCIVICLNADPGFTGTTTQNWIVELDQYPNYEFADFNHIFGVNQFNGRSQVECWVQHQQYQGAFYQNGIKEGTRDYAKKWMRTDMGSGSSFYSGGSPYYDDRPNETQWTNLQAHGFSNPAQVAGSNWYNPGYYSEDNFYQSPVPGQEAHPQPLSGKWNLYSWGYHDGYANNSNESGSTAFRGYFNCGVYYLPGFNWATGDELIDQAPGGETYFLFSAYHYGTAARGRGGLAIAES